MVTRGLGGNQFAAAKFLPPRSRFVARRRIDPLLADVFRTKHTVVAASAGSGKTTFLVQAHQMAPGVAAWYGLDHADNDGTRLLAGLSRALGLTAPAADTVELLRGATESTAVPILLVLDNAHLVSGGSGAAILDELCRHNAANLTLLMGLRPEPSSTIDSPLLQAGHDTMLIDGEHLRFRLWEAEELFAKLYNDRLPPQDVALLHQLTRGWAAALHLFHVATRELGLADRRAVLSRRQGRTRLTDEYLADQILSSLPAADAEFLIETSVLGALTASLCDQLLGVDGSAMTLHALEKRGLLDRLGDEDTFTCHEVLRAHLEAALGERLTADANMERFRAAAVLLEKEGFVSEALRALARAGDLGAVERLLDQRGEELLDDQVRIAHPTGLVAHDPWLALAAAQRSALSGDLLGATRQFREVAAAAPDGRVARLAAERARSVSVWVEANPARLLTPLGLLREASTGRPRSAAVACEDLNGNAGLLAATAARLLAGDCRGARRSLDQALRSPALDQVGANQALCLEICLELIVTGDVPVADVARAADIAEKLGRYSEARLVRSLLALSGDETARRETSAIAETAEAVGDRWGAALARLALDLGALRGGAPLGPSSEAALTDLGSPVLALWAAAARAVSGGPSVTEVRALEARARDLDVPAIRLLALRSLSRVDPRIRPTMEALAGELGLESWLEELPIAHRVSIECFDRFRVVDADGALAVGDLRPKARELLRVLAAAAGESITIERLGEELWPGVEPDRAKRNLQVAISAIRAWFASAGFEDVIGHRDDAYRLESEQIFCDVSAMRAAAEASDHESVLRLASGEFLPHDAGAEWWDRPAQRIASWVVDAALEASAARLAAGEDRQVAEICRLGLRFDRFCDELWRRQIRAHRSAGDLAAAGRAQREYQEILEELGVV